MIQMAANVSLYGHNILWNHMNRPGRWSPTELQKKSQTCGPKICFREGKNEIAHIHWNCSLFSPPSDMDGKKMLSRFIGIPFKLIATLYKFHPHSAPPLHLIHKPLLSVWKIGAVSLLQLIVPIILCYEVPDCGHYSIIDSHLSLWALSNFRSFPHSHGYRLIERLMDWGDYLCYYILWRTWNVAHSFGSERSRKKNARHSTTPPATLNVCVRPFLPSSTHSICGEWFVVVREMIVYSLFALAKDI